MQHLARTELETVLYELLVTARALAAQYLRSSIALIAEQRMSYMLHVRPYLMRAPCLQPALHKRHISEALHHAVMCHCRLADVRAWRKHIHPQPAATCFENGWWYAQSYVASNNILPAIYQVDNPDEFNAYANAIVENLGAPTYIAPTDDYKDGTEDEFYAAMETENTMEYYLVYEYDEFTILIYITDHAGNKADEGVEAGKVQYLAAGYWDVIMEEGYTLFNLR